MAITIGEFAQKLGEAGVLASQACEDYAAQRIDDAFERDDDGDLVPKVRRVHIYGQELEIPEIALISERRMDVDALTFDFEATVTMDDTGTPRIANHTGLLKRGVKVKARIMFKAGDSLESLELMRERVNREISDKLSVRRETNG